MNKNVQKLFCKHLREKERKKHTERQIMFLHEIMLSSFSVTECCFTFCVMLSDQGSTLGRRFRRLFLFLLREKLNLI